MCQRPVTELKRSWIDLAKVAKVLPQGTNSNDLVIIKLKCKLTFKGHVYFEPACPEVFKCALFI